jgi:hypothetical protein
MSLAGSSGAVGFVVRNSRGFPEVLEPALSNASPPVVATAVVHNEEQNRWRNRS